MKKLFLVLVLCLSLVSFSGCSGRAPKEVEIGPNTTKILEVGKDIAPGNYVVEMDQKITCVVVSNNDPYLDEVKYKVAHGQIDGLMGPLGFSSMDYQNISNGDKLVASDGKVIIIFSRGNTTLKQQ